MNNEIKKYWEERYKSGGTSGRGSYDKDLVNFKANTVNNLILKYNVKSLVDFGCGDGNQIQFINVPGLYLGVDISNTAIKKAKRLKNNKDKLFQFFENTTIKSQSFDMSLSLDVIFHLIDDDSFNEYMRCLFNASNNLVVIYSSNYEAWKLTRHIRHRHFISWINTNVNFTLKYKINNPFPEKSFCDFYIFQRN